MPRKSAWLPIAVLLSGVNLAAVGFAATPWWHATSHAALALVCGLWAQRMLRRPTEPEQIDAGDRAAELPAGAGLTALEADMTRLREELSETQERLDFAERMLAQRPDPRRMGSSPDKS